jgi:hypothetical protein
LDVEKDKLAARCLHRLAFEAYTLAGYQHAFMILLVCAVLAMGSSFLVAETMEGES